MLLQFAHDRTEAAIQIAAKILKQKGELSISDIKAIPFLYNSQEVASVIVYLISNLHGEIYRKKVSSQPISRWEQFIRIKQ